MNKPSASSSEPSAAAREPGDRDYLVRMRAWFDAVVEIPPAGQQAWIDAHVAGTAERSALARLLESDAAAGFFETPASGHLAEMDADAEDDPVRPDSLIGTHIGVFRLTRLLGKGGMAVVFLGEREVGDFDQQAAIKLLRRGLYSELEQRLFLRERRVLAALAHPNIAHLIDGGVTKAGIPYLVMEYVDGQPITQYAAERGLGVRERITLFLTACRATEAAHRNLVIHRDIKPANILVTGDGTLKLLDFGIAKLVADDGDATTVAVFTPEYAAPEQLAGAAVTTATDVYALGLLLHEMLLGMRPGALPPRRPSSRAVAAAPTAAAPARALERALRGDLDNIILRSLEAEPGRRYASAGALADDLARYLAGRPVEAHPPSRWYRTRKFMQRHRGGVAITAALVLGILSALGAAIWQADVALRQERAARNEAQRANAVRDFIQTLFEPVSEGVAENKQPALGDLVAAGAERLATTRDLGTTERVDLMLMFARLQASLGERARATALAEQADNLARATLDPMQPKAIDAIALRGERYVRDGAHARGEPLLLEARRRLDATGSHGVTLLHVLDNLAVVEMDRDRAGVALALSRQALQERRRAYGDEGKETASGYNNLGYGLVGVGRFDEAASAYRRAYEIDLRYRQPDSYGVLAGLSNWGWAMALGGHARDARARLADVDDGLRKLGGKPRGFHILNSEKLCIVDVQVGAAAFAERDCRRMLELTVAVTGLDSTDHAAALTVDAARLLASGDMKGAKAVLDRAGAAFPDTAQYARENGSVLAYRAEIAWLDGDAAGARRDALAARPLMALQKDKRVVSLGLDGLLVLACSRAPAAQCPADLERIFLHDLDHHAASSDVRLVLPRLVAARRLLDRGDAQAAARSIGQTLGKARVELDEGNALVATARVWHALALDLAGDCPQAAHEREAAETISGYGSYPWLAEARTALSARARCPKLH